MTNLEQRIVADKLQTRAETLRDSRADFMHRIIRAVGNDWVAIRAEYLAHLLDRIEDEANTQ